MNLVRLATITTCTLIVAASIALLAARPYNNNAKPVIKPEDNTLTAAEKKAGWVLLFDGKSTQGWRGYRNQPTEAWTVTAGQLHCKDGKVNSRADLITLQQYDNFELTFDWKIDKGFNSGVIYRSEESNEHASYVSGPEYQLIDDEGYPEKLEDWQKSGSDYAMHPPSAIAAKPAGQYNRSKIIVNGAHVEHWLNGKKVVDFELWTPEWNELKAKGKWKDAAQYGNIKKGHIALQDHGGGIWFKNVKLRKL